MDKKAKRQFPCLFVLEGSILMYQKNMLVLHTKVKDKEWMQMIEETVYYYLFLVALKEVGMPRLNEKWTKLYEYFLRGLEVNISRMRNIDALLVGRIDQEKILTAYKQKMETNSAEVLQEIKEVKEQMEKQQIEATANVKINLDLISDL